MNMQTIGRKKSNKLALKYDISSKRKVKRSIFFYKKNWTSQNKVPLKKQEVNFQKILN